MQRKKKVLAILVARSNSSRLKNKIFFKINNIPVIKIIFNKLKLSTQIDQIAITTSNNKSDDKIENFGNENKIKIFRGPENNVLKRIHQTSLLFPGFEIIVRANCDCPLFMVDILDYDIKRFKNSDYDLLSPFYKNKIPLGISFVIFKKETIDKIIKRTKNKIYQEHVENYCFDNKKDFKLFPNKYNKKYYSPETKLTLDTAADLKKIKKIFKKLDKIKNKHKAKNTIKILKNS
jgi:spore coat polysaccharide biosynthesis protein SpsF (cytidylyltransferase family)